MTNNIRGADYVASFLVSQGVKAVYLVPGGGNMYLTDAVGLAEGLEPVPMHHEQACAMAAEAYSRVTEQLGVALVTSEARRHQCHYRRGRGLD